MQLKEAVLNQKKHTAKYNSLSKMKTTNNQPPSTIMTDGDFNNAYFIFSALPVKPVGKYPDGRDKYLKIEIDIHKNLFYFKNSYELREIFKQYGFKFDQGKKCWVGNKNQFVMVSGAIFEFLSVEDRVRAWRYGAVNKYIDRVKDKLDPPKAEEKRKNDITAKKYNALDKILTSNLRAILRKYQIDGVEYIISAYLRGARGFILGDEQGLGKTLTALSFLYAVDAAGKNILFLTNNSLVNNVYNEVIKYPDCGLVRYVSFKPEPGKLCIIPYSKLSSKMYQQIRAINWDFIVCDEAHNLKNTRSKRSKNFMTLLNDLDKVKKDYFLLFMTGTLIKNRPLDAYNITKAIGLHDLNMFAFIKKFEGDKNAHAIRSRKWLGWKYYNSVDPKAVKRFTDLLMMSGLYLRRTKEEVESELPPKVRIVKPLVIEEKNEEVKMAIAKEKEILEQLKESVKPDRDIMKRVSYYRKVINVFKVDSFVEMLTEFEDKSRLVIFCHHNEVVEKLRDLIKKHYPHVDLRVIYGKTTNEERAIAVQAFQGDSDECIWLITSFSVGSEGLTLTKADTVLFLELDWSISTLLQAEDRIHRISQTKVCMYYYYIALNTLDQYMYNVLYKKAKYLEQFTAKASYIKEITESHDNFYNQADSTNKSPP